MSALSFPAAWAIRVEAECFARNLTFTQREVLKKLRASRGPRGAMSPTHETLAREARCSIRSVVRALRHAAELGLINWHEGPRRREGWRLLRTANHYFLLLPKHPITRAKRRFSAVRATKCQVGVEEDSSKKKEAQEEHKRALAMLLVEAKRGPDLLAMRRNAFEAQQRAQQRARYLGQYSTNPSSSGECSSGGTQSGFP